MIAGAQSLRNAMPFEVFRAGKMRIFQQPVAETLLFARGLLAHEARLEAGRGLDDGQSCNLSAVEYGVSYADRLYGEDIEKACVKSLVTSADQRQCGFPRKFPGQLLSEGSSAGAERDHAPAP